MTVYVDDMMAPWRPKWAHNGMWHMCHMFVDTDEELHALAKRIGLQRRWFQCPPKASWPHYDVTAGKRKLALEFGAVAVRYRDIPKLWRDIEQARKSTCPAQQSTP